MRTSLGPWATAAGAGSKAHLSTFWKRRLAMLPGAHRSNAQLGGGVALLLLIAAGLVWALPTLRGAAAQPERERPAAPAATVAKAKEQKAAMRTVRVRVVGPEGKAVAGASVRVHAAVKGQRQGLNKDYTSDADGQAVIELPQTFLSLWLNLSKDDYLTLSTGWGYEWLAAGHQVPQDLTIKLTKPTPEQARAIAEIRKLDGSIEVAERDKGQRVWAHLAGERIADAGLEFLHRLPDLDELQVIAPNVTDAGLAHLESLHGLKTLVLSSERITNAGLAHLESLRGLKELKLMGPRITDAGLAHLQPLRSLEKLTLACAITDAGVKHLTPLKELRTLISWGVRADRARLGVFQELEKPTMIDGVDVSLQHLCRYLSGYHGIKVQIDDDAFRAAKINKDMPITCKVKEVPLGEALHRLPAPVGLDWLVEKDTLLITTRDIVLKRHPEVAALQQALPNLKLVIVNW